MNDLARFRWDGVHVPAPRDDLHTLLQRALADTTTSNIERNRPVFNALRLQCGWAENPREVHESIVLQLSAHNVGVDWTTSVPIHEVASQIAKQPAAISFVTIDGRVDLLKVFEWVSTLAADNPAKAAIEPHAAYFASLHDALVGNGELVPKSPPPAPASETSSPKP